MATPQEIQEIIEAAIPGAKAQAEDQTGTGDHYAIKVVAAAFEGISMVAQHQMIYKALGDRMKEEIHALAIQTETP